MSARTRRTPPVGTAGLAQSTLRVARCTDRSPEDPLHDWRRLTDEERARGLHHVRELRDQLHRDEQIWSLGHVIVTRAEMVELVRGRDMATAQAGGR